MCEKMITDDGMTVTKRLYATKYDSVRSIKINQTAFLKVSLAPAAISLLATSIQIQPRSIEGQHVLSVQ